MVSSVHSGKSVITEALRPSATGSTMNITLPFSQRNTLAECIRADYNSGVGGPYSDSHGTIEALAKWVKDGANGHGLVETAGTYLMPINLEGGPQSRLKTPFVVMKRDASPLFRASAGDVLNKCQMSKYQDKDVFVADAWELAAIEVAVLRQLGIEASFGFFHYTPENPHGVTAKTPCVVLPGNNDKIPVEFILPPGTVALLAQNGRALEVLDQNALYKLVCLKETLARLKSFMQETKFLGGNEGVGIGGITQGFSQDQEQVHAIDLGHVFSGVGGISLKTETLTVGDAKKSSVVGNKTIGTIAAEYVHLITCGTCENNMAILEIISNKEVRRLSGTLLHSAELRLEEIPPIRKVNGEVLEMFKQRLVEYTKLWKLMMAHNHTETECQNNSVI